MVRFANGRQVAAHASEIDARLALHGNRVRYARHLELADLQVANLHRMIDQVGVVARGVGTVTVTRRIFRADIDVATRQSCPSGAGGATMSTSQATSSCPTTQRNTHGPLKYACVASRCAPRTLRSCA